MKPSEKICSVCKLLLSSKNFHRNIRMKDGLHYECKECRASYNRKNKEINRIKLLNIKEETPWIIYHKNARKRCIVKTSKDYKYYGGKGIRFCLSKNDVRKMWFRDNADLLKSPSIDRIDSNGDYIFDNCRFIELSENVRRSNNQRWGNE